MKNLAFEMDRQVLQRIMQIQKEMYQMRKFKIFQVFLKVTGQLHKYAFSGALLSR
jgi:hypothetical protein